MNEQRALVVDDSKVGRLTMMKKLEAMGLKVDLVESGRQALDYLAQHRPDVIFMDHMMPDMDGFETTQRIKADPATGAIPVIIISGNDDEDFVRQARAVGALNAISKPPGAGVLEALLHDLPHLAAAPAEHHVAQPVPQPAVAEKPKAPSMDQAAVHALVERMLGEAMEHLHADLLADIGQQVDAAFAHERITQQERSESWRQELDQTRADVDAVRRGVAEAEALGQRLQGLEQRLAPLEAEASQPLPDVEALGKALEQRITMGLDELREEARDAAARQEPMLESLRQDLSSRLDERLALAGQGMGDLAARLDGLSAQVGQIADDAQSAREGLDHRLSDLGLRLAALEDLQAVPGVDGEAILAAVEERFASRVATLESDFQARWEEQEARPGDETLFEGAVAPLRERYEALRVEFDGQHDRLEAMEQALSTLQAELTAQGETLRVTVAEEGERLLASLGEGQSRVASELEAQQARLESWDDGMHRLQALEQRLESMPAHDIDADVQRVLEQRIAQMREVIGAALQPAYPGRDAGTDVGSAPLPETGREALPTAGPWHDHMQSDVDRLKGRVKTLTILLAVGGAALLLLLGRALLGG